MLEARNTVAYIQMQNENYQVYVWHNVAVVQTVIPLKDVLYLDMSTFLTS